MDEKRQIKDHEHQGHHHHGHGGGRSSLLAVVDVLRGATGRQDATSCLDRRRQLASEDSVADDQTQQKAAG